MSGIYNDITARGFVVCGEIDNPSFKVCPTKLELKISAPAEKRDERLPKAFVKEFSPDATAEVAEEAAFPTDPATLEATFSTAAAVVEF